MASSGIDADRRLVRGGQAEARLSAKALEKENVLPDLVLCSTARRARETALIVAEVLGLPSSCISFEDRLYGIDSLALKDLLSASAEDDSVLLVVGHNPAVSDLVRLLSPQEERAMAPGEIVGFAGSKLPGKGKTAPVLRFRPEVT